MNNEEFLPPTLSAGQRDLFYVRYPGSDNRINLKTAVALGMPIYWMTVNWPGNNAVTRAAAERPVVIISLNGDLHYEHGKTTVPWNPCNDGQQFGPIWIKHRADIIEHKLEYYRTKCPVLGPERETWVLSHFTRWIQVASPLVWLATLADLKNIDQRELIQT